MSVVIMFMSTGAEYHYPNGVQTVKEYHIKPICLHANGLVKAVRGELKSSPGGGWCPIGPEHLMPWVDNVVLAPVCKPSADKARRDALIIYSNIAVSLCGAELTKEKHDFYQAKRALYEWCKEVSGDETLPDLTPFDIILASCDEPELI